MYSFFYYIFNVCVSLTRYPDNYPRGKSPPPPVMVGAWVKVRVSFRVGGNQTIASEDNCLAVSVSFGVGGFSLKAIVLELFDNEVEILDRTSLVCLLFDNFVWIILKDKLLNDFGNTNIF